MSNSLFATGFKTSPWWWEAAEPPTRDNAMPDHTPVAVIGGGYAGLSAALSLARLGHQVTVLDAERIGWGASSRNGGMVYGELKVARAALAEKLGAEQARNIADVTGLPTEMLPPSRQHEALGSDHYHGGMKAGATGSIHPGKYARGLAAAAERAGAKLAAYTKSRTWRLSYGIPDAVGM